MCSLFRPNPLGILLALFVGVPLLDTITLVLVGRYLGFWPTVAIVLLSGVIGAQLTRRQGLSVWRSLQADLAAGRVPAQGLMDCVLMECVRSPYREKRGEIEGGYGLGVERREPLGLRGAEQARVGSDEHDRGAVRGSGARIAEVCHEDSCVRGI